MSASAKQVVRISGMVAGMDPEIPASDYGEIEELITSEDSPVGIDAKKTHVIIIHKLLQIEERLDRLERLVAAKTPQEPDRQVR